MNDGAAARSSEVTRYYYQTEQFQWSDLNPHKEDSPITSLTEAKEIAEKFRQDAKGSYIVYGTSL